MPIYSIREQAIRVIGEPRCHECNWDTDIRCLAVVDTSGQGKSLRDHMSRDKYYAMAASEAQTNPTHPYRVLCANCSMMRMWDKKREIKPPPAQVSVKSIPIVVWKSSLGKTDTFCVHKFLDNYLASGYDVYIFFNDKVVPYLTGCFENTFHTWRLFAEATNITMSEPTQAITVYER